MEHPPYPLRKGKYLLMYKLKKLECLIDAQPLAWREEHYAE